MYAQAIVSGNFIIYPSSFEYVFQLSLCIRAGAKSSLGKTWGNSASQALYLEAIWARVVAELQDRAGMQTRWGSRGWFKIWTISGMSREGSQTVTCTRTDSGTDQNMMKRAEIL